MRHSFLREKPIQLEIRWQSQVHITITFAWAHVALAPVKLGPAVTNFAYL